MGSVMDFLFIEWLTKPLWMWLMFLGIVVTLLVLDLGVLHREHREIRARESLVLSAVYIGLGLSFGLWVWWSLGAQSGMEYLTGFAVEKALAMDNVFVIAMIFSFFAVPPKYQHRVLFWGILGVIVLRAIMIGLGAAIVDQFSWVLYVFALFLIATGVKMIVFADKEYDVAKNPLLSFMRKRFNVTDEHHGEKFFVRKFHPVSGKPAWFMTPLFLALVLIEVADVIFAVDSVPAIFAITTDPFIVYTSNIFAILGLRALYFALAAMVNRFHYLKLALAIVLIFIGSKIFWRRFWASTRSRPWCRSRSPSASWPRAFSTACGKRGRFRRSKSADGGLPMRQSVRWLPPGMTIGWRGFDHGQTPPHRHLRAGPAGLAAALALGRLGHRISLFDQFDRPRPLGSGLILQPTGLAVLDRLGLLARIEGLGARIDRLYGRACGSGRVVLDVRYEALGRLRGLAVHRAALFNVLHDAVREEGLEVQTASQISGLDGAVVILNQGRREGPFDLVVDALGSRSPLIPMRRDLMPARPSIMARCGPACRGPARLRSQRARTAL